MAGMASSSIPENVRNGPNWSLGYAPRAARLTTPPRLLFYSEGRQDAIEESGEFLTEDNWQEGFGSINSDIRCSGCGQKTPGWLHYETM